MEDNVRIWKRSRYSIFEYTISAIADYNQVIAKQRKVRVSNRGYTNKKQNY